MALFDSSPKTVTTHSGGQTISKDYDRGGKLVDVRHTNDKTGETHSHVPGHHPLGSDTGPKRR